MNPREGAIDIGDSVAKEGDYYIKNGEFADLYKGVYASPQGKVTVAIKAIRGVPAFNKVAIERVNTNLNREAQTWLRLRHANVVRFYGISDKVGYLPAIVLQFCEHGNVSEYLTEKEKKMAGSEFAILKLRLIVDSAQGLAYLHGQNVKHGDIRASNVLVTSEGVACLADYGLVYVIESADFTTTKIAGPARWSSPEILNPPEDPTLTHPGQPIYTEASDVYAFAMLIHEICTLKVPYSERRNDSAVIFRILDGDRPAVPELVQEVKEMIENCWSSEVDKRPSAGEMLKNLQDTYGARIAKPWWIVSVLSNVLEQAGSYFPMTYMRRGR